MTFLLGVIFMLSSSQHANAEEANWGYVGDTGPEHWGELSPALSICSEGHEQSPIDIKTSMTVKAEPPVLVLHWQAFAPAIMNSGHSLEVSTQGQAGSAAVGNRKYQFVQFHFHHGSEHRINGKQADAEIHFVHQSDEGDLLVIAVLVETGVANAKLDNLLNHIPAKGQFLKPEVVVSPENLLPGNPAGYRYKGSLTTPGCFEIITWHVVRDAVTLSAKQLQELRSTFPSNVRPVQEIGRRYILVTD